MCSQVGRRGLGEKYRNIYIEYSNVSVYNTTIYFIYFKIVHRQGDMFRLHWVILRPSKKTDPKLHGFKKNASWDSECSHNVIKVLYKL